MRQDQLTADTTTLARSPAAIPRLSLDHRRLEQHNLAVMRDLEALQLPAKPWLPPTHAPDGHAIYDVIVIGAGMYGIAAAAALKLAGIDNILVLDKAEKGKEGPWTTFARMPTLRSPKELPGVSLGIPSLTFRAWYEAAYGVSAFQSLYKVWNQDWQDYLTWVQQVLSLPVEHKVNVTTLTPAKESVDLVLQDGRRKTARRVIVATGRNGTGGASLPSFIDQSLFPDHAAHTFEEIDFRRLRGLDIAVIGAGASAWDNAATALEAGASRVTMFARRAYLPQINKGRATNIGFLEGWSSLADKDRWSMAAYFDRIQSPPPHETIHRTMRHENFHLQLGARIQAVTQNGSGVTVALEDGESNADFAIVGTGFDVDLRREPLLAGIIDDLLLWKDHYTPSAEEARPHLGLYPYLGPGFECVSKTAGSEATGLGLIHIFNSAAFVSHGHQASDVPGLTISAQRLGRAIMHHLFRDSFDALRNRLLSWDEHELAGTPLYRRVRPDTQIAISDTEPF